MTDRELDAMVAEHVMGWYRTAMDWFVRKGKFRREPKPYSTDIAAAWLVVEAMRERGWSVFIDDMPDGASAQVVNLNCEHHADEHDTGSYASGTFRGGYCALSEAKAPKAPRAICLAALRALGVEVPE